MDRNEKILVVDDDESLVAMLRALLLSNGYKVEGAFSGAEALRLIKDFRPDLILMDIGLPDMSGLEVLRQVRADPSTQETVVIVVTGSSGLEMKVEGFNTGANDYVSKPINAREVLLKIERFLQSLAYQRHALSKKQTETLRTLVHTFLYEFSSPLAAIRNQLCLASQEQNVEPLKNHFNQIESTVKNMEQIIIKLQSTVRLISREVLPGVQLLDLDASSKQEAPNSSL